MTCLLNNGLENVAHCLKTPEMDSFPLFREPDLLRMSEFSGPFRYFRPVKREWTGLPSPTALKEILPAHAPVRRTVADARNAICDILTGEDPRLLVVAGPCSIHDEASALEYAERLGTLAARTSDSLFLVMRTYLEKPRTSLGWKGLVNDPYMDGSCDMAEGLYRARHLLIRINEMGVPAATEMLEPLTPAFLSDLVSWSAIGARTTESQIHREMASGLPMPVGFKNSTTGSIEPAMNAMKAAEVPQTFPGIDPHGRASVIRTSGNPWGHIVLRGGDRETNYDRRSIQETVAALTRRNLRPVVMVDCSHGNSRKDHRRQTGVFTEVISDRIEGNPAVRGLMIESHLREGRQAFSSDPSRLAYGVSITDACISWKETERLLLNAADGLAGKGRIA